VTADAVFKLPYIFYKILGRNLTLLDPAALTTIGPLLVLAVKTTTVIVAVSSQQFSITVDSRHRVSLF